MRVPHRTGTRVPVPGSTTRTRSVLGLLEGSSFSEKLFYGSPLLQLLKEYKDERYVRGTAHVMRHPSFEKRAGTLVGGYFDGSIESRRVQAICTARGLIVQPCPDNVNWIHRSNPKDDRSEARANV